MSGSQLRDFAQFRDLPSSGTLAQVAKRISAECHRDLAELVCSRSPWTREDWNDFVVEHFHGAPRRSFEEICDEIERGLAGVAEDVVAELSRDRVSVADLRRDDDLLEEYASLLRVSPRRLLNAVADVHGRTLVASLAEDLVRQFQPHASGGTIAEDDDEDADDDAFFGGGTEPPASEHQSAAAASSTPVAAVTRTLEKPPIGHLLNGRWRIVRELGSGGMGTAYEVVNARQHVRVAKVAHSDGTDTTALVREADTAFELAHDNVCRYYDLDDDRKYGVFAIMQHCGESLHKRYAKKGADPMEAGRLLAMAAAGIDYLHRRGFIHGDISPANILVDAKGQVRITDFGIATEMRAVTRTAGLTHVGELRGRNQAFAADEVNAGQPLRRSSDQASLAKVLCALLMGVEAYQREPRFSFQRLGPGQAALDRALHRDHQQRFENCRRFIGALTGEAQ